ncbi:hypothetical protein PFISCL1PPCAC_3117 [Pristionchus fissidentatus]|uniref:F-box domain-containing protein n=1 Tax=Pristionchus fissidentatus TaxID=1538716 RepID=A0AAV5V1X6_9BILA|nr:hypothetical protein PFISCL1PPCAC_3117 [Pristionchus fissidentatus]
MFVVYYIFCCCSNNTNSVFQTHPLTLEALPKENVYRILSNLHFNDRQTVSKCSKSMREVVQRSYLWVERIELRFGEEQLDTVQLAVHFSCDLSLNRTVNQKHAETMENWLSEKSKTLCFRRILADKLHIQCHAGLVEESILHEVTALFDIRICLIKLHKRAQPSLMNFLHQSKRSIDCLETIGFAPNPKEIIQLPRLSNIRLDQSLTGFSDEEVLDIARIGLQQVQIPANLSHTATISRAVEIVRSHKPSNRRAAILSLFVPIPFCHRFLASIGLREEGGMVIDVTNPARPPIPTVFSTGWHGSTRYFLDMGDCSLMIVTSRGKRQVAIYNRSADDRPCLKLALARVSAQITN